MTILPIKHKIEHKSIKAQKQKYSIKKEQNRTHEKKNAGHKIFNITKQYINDVIT